MNLVRNVPARTEEVDQYRGSLVFRGERRWQLKPPVERPPVDPKAYAGSISITRRDEMDLVLDSIGDVT
jgi:hypothetical protein